MQSVDKKSIVFIIEDDPFLIRAYQSAFAKENIEVWTAQDGETAVSFLDREMPDVVLLDLMLPGMNGFEVLEKIRANSRWRDIPVIIVTNLSDPADIEKGKNLGAVEYRIKAQVNIDSLVQDVKHYVHLV